MEYKIFKVTYNDGGWHSGELPYFYYIAYDEEEVRANSKKYLEFKERQDAFGGDIWLDEVNGLGYTHDWENLKDFNVIIQVALKEN